MMRPHFFVIILLALVVTLPTNARQKQTKPLTNDDVVKMVKAGLSSDVVIATIKASAHDFDLSPDALIKLKQAGVPDTVIEAMAEGSKPSASQIPPPSNSDIYSVTIIDGDRQIPMKRIESSGMRTSGVGMKVINPFAKMKELQIFPNAHASLRVGTNSPQFDVRLPRDLEPSTGGALVKLSVKSDHREISVASGRLGASVGYSKSDMLQIKVVPQPTGQTDKNARDVIVRLACVRPLSAGEYALVVQGVYYDFGIDGER